MITRIVAITALALAVFVALGGRGASQSDADVALQNGMQRMQSVVNKDTHDMISSQLQDSENVGREFATNIASFAP